MPTASTIFSIPCSMSGGWMPERWRKHAPSYTFHLVLPATMPPLACDAVRIEQAINHLLNNAVKYSAPTGGPITLQLDVNEVELCLRVSDHGVGIAPEHLDRIFDRFYRIPLDESENGSGLGLAVARATIEAHGGRIWADSPGVGQGATFYCTLPLHPRLSSFTSVTSSPADPASSLLSAHTAPLRQRERLHVLVGEHDPR